MSRWLVTLEGATVEVDAETDHEAGVIALATAEDHIDDPKLVSIAPLPPIGELLFAPEEGES